MKTDQALLVDICRALHINDSTRWKDHDIYQAALSSLLRDLKASVQ